MTEKVIPPELQPTAKGRTTRILILIKLIKEKKKLPVEEVLKYVMNNWWISLRVAKAYLRDLEIAGIITIKTEGQKEYVVYKEG
jgi:predicted transcriptional regulator